ncbi:MAG: RNase adapter RapZ [Deltaproteobacteria bacterium]|nr:RNase adapter RapZ [Deltaproteobacteria bacterium]
MDADNLPPKKFVPRLILLTGLSGAGKSTAAKALEDAGFFCIDNFPARLLPDLLEKIINGSSEHLALVMDVRDPDFLKDYAVIFRDLQAALVGFTVIFLESEDLVILRRYSAMRRRHPAGCGSVREGIAQERRQLAAVKELAHRVIDTSTMNPHELRRIMLKKYDLAAGRGLSIGILSFGFKYGPPVEADLLFDVRFLANPYFVAELKERSGLEPEVAGYVLQNASALEFIERLTAFLRFLIPRYEAEGKTYLTIGIGCTGGHHRSVAVARRLADLLRLEGHNISVTHRDLVES